MGIGSFSYYRRVVENQKARILQEIRKVAERLGANPTVLESLDRALKETQFSSAVDDVKAANFSQLSGRGHNARPIAAGTDRSQFGLKLFPQPHRQLHRSALCLEIGLGRNQMQHADHAGVS